MTKHDTEPREGHPAEKGRGHEAAREAEAGEARRHHEGEQREGHEGHREGAEASALPPEHEHYYRHRTAEEAERDRADVESGAWTNEYAAAAARATQEGRPAPGHEAIGQRREQAEEERGGADGDTGGAHPVGPAEA